MNAPRPGRSRTRFMAVWLTAAVLIPLAACAVVLGHAVRDDYLRTLLALALVSLGGIAALTAAILLARRLSLRVAAAERERDLLREQLIESGKLAAVGEQAAGVAHEINNPVAIMMEEAGWVLDILTGDDFAAPDNVAEMRRALAQIRLQGTRCKDITHRLLTFARRPDETRSDVDLNVLAEEMVALSEKRTRTASVRVTTDLAPDLPLVAGSASQLQQVLLNLINNALDAMAPNGGELTITTRPAGPMATLSVADSGHGIPPAVLDRVFEPFFTTKAVGKGTGLGLSICAGIVRKLGGEITVTSRPHQGATFHVSLPIATNRPPAARPGAGPTEMP
ncbi:sensor histidine kinase [Solidesulfovibrio sp.]